MAMSIRRNVFSNIKLANWRNIYAEHRTKAPKWLTPKNFPQTAFERAEHPERPSNLEGEFKAGLENAKGDVYDDKPFRAALEAGKKYAWCVCGHSKQQPFCDSSHKRVKGLKATFAPVRFTVEETKDYWLCNCKQTNNRPFCDGTHKQFKKEKRSVP